MLGKEQKKQVIAKFARATNDSGSSEVQVGILTERIKQISAHLKLFPKDKNSQRGLIVLVGKRRSLIGYLKKNDRAAYKRMQSLLEEKEVN
jgi:small subunit ribosomal protein S15